MKRGIDFTVYWFLTIIAFRRKALVLWIISCKYYTPLCPEARKRDIHQELSSFFAIWYGHGMYGSSVLHTTVSSSHLIIPYAQWGGSHLKLCTQINLFSFQLHLWSLLSPTAPWYQILCSLQQVLYIWGVWKKLKWKLSASLFKLRSHITYCCGCHEDARLLSFSTIANSKSQQLRSCSTYYSVCTAMFLLFWSSANSHHHIMWSF